MIESTTITLALVHGDKLSLSSDGDSLVVTYVKRGRPCTRVYRASDSPAVVAECVAFDWRLSFSERSAVENALEYLSGVCV